jgi:transposase
VENLFLKVYSLTPADLALGYKQLQRVEDAWRTLKSGLRLRPVYHWAVHRMHAHVAVSVLALLLERVIEQACGPSLRMIDTRSWR